MLVGMARRPIEFLLGSAAVLLLALLPGCTIRGVRGLTPSTTVARTTTTSTLPAPTTTTTLPPTTTTTAPPFPKPQVVECRGPVTVDIVFAPVDPRLPIDCAEPHGSETVAVLDLPPSITEYPVDGLPAEVKANIEESCQIALDTRTGASPKGTTGRVSSRLAVAWYLPPLQDWDLGARWVRCDGVVTPIGPLQASYAGRFRDVLAGDQVPFPLTRCFDRSLQLTFCEASHAFEATVEVKLPDGPEPPDATVTDQLRVEHCDPLTAAAIGVGGMDEQPQLRTILLVPQGDLWATSDHIGLCIVGAANGGLLNDSVRGIGSRTPPIEAPRPTAEPAG